MSSGLKDPAQLARFLGVSLIGTVADYALALALSSWTPWPLVVASTCGFVLGSVVNYVGHNLFSYTHTGRHTITIVGYLKYFGAVILSLVVRLAAVALLEWPGALPAWFILLAAIGASFVASYTISTLWIFRKPD